MILKPDFSSWRWKDVRVRVSAAVAGGWVGGGGSIFFTSSIMGAVIAGDTFGTIASRNSRKDSK